MSNTVFWKKKICEETGLFDETLNYNMDGEFFARLFWNRKIKYINFPIAYFRWHDEAKTIKNRGDFRTQKYFKELATEFNYSINKIESVKNKKIKYPDLIRKIYKGKRILLRFFYGHYFK